jgi:hypothetical protein
MKTLLWIAILVTCVAGCSDNKNNSQTKSNDNVELKQDNSINLLLKSWLEEHGHKNVVLDVDGVGIENNKTRYLGKVYSFNENSDGFTAELEISIKIPDGRIITDYAAGFGKDKPSAINSALISYILATAHPVYKSFINTQDPHLEENVFTINGQKRTVVYGDIYTISNIKDKNLDFSKINDEISTVISNLKLDNKPHWIKIIYCQSDSKISESSASVLDNQDNSIDLTKHINSLNWPKSNGFYMAKLYVIIK